MNAQVVPVVTPEAILAELQKQAPAAQRALAVDFARAFLARVPADELEQHEPAEWAATLLSNLEFSLQREPGRASVRVFNPGVDAGFGAGATVVQMVNDDMSFLVDSVGMALAAQGLSSHGIVHPVFPVTRDAGGKLVAVGSGQPESLIQILVDRVGSEADLAALRETILVALADVRSAFGDWQAMRGKMEAIAQELGSRRMPASAEMRAEAQEFLRWAADNHFTFLGYREYEVCEREGKRVLAAVPDTSLGIMRGHDAEAKPRPLTGLAAAGLKPGTSIDPLILTKTNARSTVHRPGYMDYIGVLCFDEAGNAIAEQRFLGLYTSSAYNRRPWEIPLVRQRYAEVMSSSGLGEGSHSGKALRHILETLPRDELFQSGAEELSTTSMGILALRERARTRLFLRRDRHGRFYSALAYIPRDRFTADVRERIEAMLMRELKGDRLDTSVQIGESPLAQLHLLIRPRSGESVQVDPALLEAELVHIVRNWQDQLRDHLVQEHGEEQGIRLANRFGKALPAGYVESTSPEQAATDVGVAAALAGEQALHRALYRVNGSLRFKLIRPGKEIALSDALPMLENLGLRINSEHPYEIELEDGRVVIQDFAVEPLSGQVDVEAARGRFEDAFAAVWRGDAENDGFNRLVLAAGLDWRQVAMLRGYCKFLLQTGVTFSQAYMEETLARYPLVARLLVELFEARFEPGRDVKADSRTCEALRQDLTSIVPVADRAAMATILEEMGADRALDREAQIDACGDALSITMEKVQSLDEDRILRAFETVINATLRTSYFQKKGAGGTHKDYISFKFDPALVPELPKPRPYREIFVYSPFVEGVHLRFGPVARGGLRWSDRREDFRTEVLGLVKAQMVKNTVIVPVGSKGGFFVKRPPVGGDRDAVLAEGIACYKRFINGLLDITDNLVDGKVVHPADVVRHDGDDPYLVVAADKGTATFSDIANGISAEHGYWLGDAFASGGSVGYDHKGMGITAKGAWESVKRHFRALGRDSQTQDFTCVGIGDMSGDVFGNGMLLSEHIRLLAAFDHRHIFLDPNPDSAITFKERQRMFALPRSSWEDYDKSLISEGGGVYPRSAKSIPVSPQIREALQIEAEGEQLSPSELMNAILKAPVDLLWNGGIGTYVKHSSENNAEVGDRANNALRVDGNQLRCKMVGEGGNLGMTQKGRIEAAQQAGVLLNTDFIDNSAGVDTSDHEVNIKILLAAPVKRGEMSMEQRNALLASMTDEVGELVLNDNYRQNQAISLMESMSAARLGSFGHFIRTLEGQGLLDRAIEFLPSDAEMAERKSRGAGLTRPELSVLLSYDKIVIFNELLDSDVPEDPYLSKELVRYFPAALQERYATDMEQHRLRREIIATAVTNSTVNRMGATFVQRMQEDTGAPPSQIAKAYTISREVLEARSFWTGIDSLDLHVPEEAQLWALTALWHLQRNLTRWLLNRPGEQLVIAKMVERYAMPMRQLRDALPGILPPPGRAQLQADLAGWKTNGFRDELALGLACLPWLSYGLDIVEVALERKLPVADVAQVYFGLSEALHSKWLMDSVEKLPVEGRWHAQARGVLRDELQAQQRALVGNVLASAGKDDKPENLVRQWLGRDDAGLRYTLNMFSDMRNLRTMDFATLSVAVRRLAHIAAAGARAG